MKREIKFRAWDGEKMLENPKFEFFNHGRNGRAVMMADENENVEIMQYTGLKDKKGKEIYEGDILHVIEEGIYGGEYNIEVKWLRNWGIYGGNCFDVKTIKSSSSNDRVVDTTKTVGFITRHYGNCISLSELIGFKICEIIGNIYENKDLIK